MVELAYGNCDARERLVTSREATVMVVLATNALPFPAPVKMVLAAAVVSPVPPLFTASDEVLVTRPPTAKSVPAVPAMLSCRVTWRSVVLAFWKSAEPFTAKSALGEVVPIPTCARRSI